MLLPKVFVGIKHNDLENPRHPMLFVRVFEDKINPERLVVKLKEAGFLVEVERDPTVILTVISKVRIERGEMIKQLIDILKVWHDELCGELQVIKTLFVQHDVPRLKLTEHTPAEDSCLMRMGLLKSRLRVAIEIQDYEGAAVLRDKLKALAADSLV